MEFRSITQIIVVMKLSLIHFLFYYTDRTIKWCKSQLSNEITRSETFFCDHKLLLHFYKITFNLQLCV